MSRCPDCGMKECCGSYMSEDIERLQDEMDSIIKSKAAWMEEFNKAQAEIDELKSDFIRLHTMAFKWVDKDHHDWQELMKLRWGE